jgi:glycosyltransferase 2 family protein
MPISSASECHGSKRCNARAKTVPRALKSENQTRSSRTDARAHHCEPKPNVTSTITQTAIEKLGRNWRSVAITLSILIAAILTLGYLLRDIDVDKVIAALKAQSERKILIAGAFVVAGYVTLIFYDLFALRTIGRSAVPFRVAALASFTSFTIGHSLGAATLTSGLVRLRVYSAWGLNVVDIAKIAFVTGLTFWLGNAFVLGGALVYAPDAASAVDHLPPWINRTIGLSGLTGIVCYLLWLAPRPRVVGRANWRIELPNLRFTLVQIGIGATDLVLVTLAMYTLLPPQPAVDFATILVIFLTATLLGTISHAPGSLGVIEAAVLIGLPQFQKEELLAALLTFRALYFVLPLVLASCALAVRELGLLARPPTKTPRP